MTDDVSNNNPANQSAQHPPTEFEVSSTAPEQEEIATQSARESSQEQDTARELRREFRWFEFLSLCINGALAIIGIIALCVYYGQLKVTIFKASSREERLFVETKLALAFKGKITYNNGFDEIVELPLCAYVFGYQVKFGTPERVDTRSFIKQCSTGTTFENATKRALWEIGMQQHTIDPATPAPASDQ